MKRKFLNEVEATAPVFSEACFCHDMQNNNSPPTMCSPMNSLGEILDYTIVAFWLSIIFVWVRRAEVVRENF